MVIWITGLSASGKTTLGLEMYKLLKDSGSWVFLDGDTIRRVFGEDLGHSVEDRMKNAYRISNLCGMLESQNISVIACVLLISNEVRENNKKCLKEYKEVFIDVPMETLFSRDNKELYKNALNGKENNVVGIDIHYDLPSNADFTFINDADGIDFTKKSIEIIKKFNLNIDKNYPYSANNRLKHPEKYEYTKYKGSLFFDAYEKNRMDAVAEIENYGNNLSFIVGEWGNNAHGTTKLLLDMYLNTKNGSIQEGLLKLIQRFEVSKKIYDNYEQQLWKRTSETYSDIKNYLIFGLILICAYDVTKNNGQKLIFFNSLLKLNDLLISIDLKDEYEQTVLSYCINKELLIYREIAENV